MSDRYLDKLKELLITEVFLSNNQLLLLTGTFNYYIDSQKLDLDKHLDVSYLKDTIEKKLEECGLFQDTKLFLKNEYRQEFEELVELKHDFFATKLALQNKEILLLLYGLDHFVKHEGHKAISKKYLEIKDYLEGILKEGSK